jgi:hypothetical protein
MTMMRWTIGVTMALGLALGPAWAGYINNPTHLTNNGQGKVSNVKAKQWMQQDGSKGGYDQMGGGDVVNIGSRRAGTCNMNVGSSPGNDSKDTIVTAKNIINICK